LRACQSPRRITRSQGFGCGDAAWKDSSSFTPKQSTGVYHLFTSPRETALPESCPVSDFPRVEINRQQIGHSGAPPYRWPLKSGPIDSQDDSEGQRAKAFPFPFAPLQTLVSAMSQLVRDKLG